MDEKAKEIATAAKFAGIDQLATDQLHIAVRLFEALQANDPQRAEEIAYSLTAESADAIIAFLIMVTEEA